MGYQERSPIDSSSLSTPLSDILGIPVRDVQTTFQNKGYSGAVYRAEAISESGNQQLIIKRVEDQSNLQLYQNFLLPLGLFSPKMHGMFDLNNEPYLVMNYIEHVKPKWSDITSYLGATDLLIEKDNLVRACVDTRNPPLGVKPHVVDKTDEWIKACQKGVDYNLSQELNSSFLTTLLEKQDVIEGIAVSLSTKGPLTVVHNDYQLNNVLSSVKDGRKYLIDWTEPTIGSVCIDLAQLVNVAPAHMRDQILKYYRDRNNFNGFLDLYDLADIRDNLKVVSWAIEAVLEGQTNILSYLDINEKVTRTTRLLKKAGN